MTLSYSEKRVYELVLKGLSNKDIANRIGVTEKTVKFHLTNIFAKTKKATRAELIVGSQDESVTINELKIFKTILNL